MGLFSAILLGVQLAFAFLPNIELVSLLIILYTRHLKYRALASDLCLCSFGRIDFRVWYLVDYIFVYLGDFICLDNAGPKEPIVDRVGDDFRRIRTFFWGAWVDFVSFFKRPAGGVRLVCSGDPV